MLTPRRTFQIDDIAKTFLRFWRLIRSTPKHPNSARTKPEKSATLPVGPIFGL